MTRTFPFGENWASFSRQLTEARVEQAAQSLEELFGSGNLRGKSFLDIGCGSGLFAIAAARLGASPVLGIDADPLAVKTSRQNASTWLKNPGQVTFSEASILDEEWMAARGTFDIVYSWGVLHHTGNLRRVISIAARSVNPSGLLMIAIYNRHWSSPIWTFIKWLYNHSKPAGQRLITAIFTPLIFLAKRLITGRDPRLMRRGMDFKHNVVDWVGGYPYEYASKAEVEELLANLGFQINRTIPATVPTGCNEFLAQRRA